MVMPVPKMFDIVKLPDDFDELPQTQIPYYVAAKEGLYLFKSTAIGPCLIPQKDMPSLNSMGEYKAGYFQHKIPDVPTEIMSQALDFFRKVFFKNKAEAEVFILLNIETREFKLFVPWQVTSHGGVDSLYDEADIPEGFTIIGTIHSHCDFSAFHSATDLGDASDFNGLHITIGHVDRESGPSFDQMVMINKLKFTYKSIDSVADVSNLGAATAPDEWLGFVFDNVNECVDRYFPTLTKEQIDEFVKQCRPVYLVSNDKKNDKKHSGYNSQYDYGGYYSAGDDDYGDWRDWLSQEQKSGRGYLTETRWSDDFRKSLPSEFFVSQAYGSKLTKEGFAAAMTETLENLWMLAAGYDVFLEYAMKEYSRDDSHISDEDYKATGAN